jgi:hypothetical protein
MKIRAVIFDLGGVVLGSPPQAFRAYEAEHGIEINFLNRMVMRNGRAGAWARLERGIERAFLDLEPVTGGDLEPAQHAEPVHGAPAQGFEEQEIEGASDEVEAGGGWHGNLRLRSPTIPKVLRLDAEEADLVAEPGEAYQRTERMSVRAKSSPTNSNGSSPAAARA